MKSLKQRLFEAREYMSDTKWLNAEPVKNGTLEELQNRLVKAFNSIDKKAIESKEYKKFREDNLRLIQYLTAKWHRDGVSFTEMDKLKSAGYKEAKGVAGLGDILKDLTRSEYWHDFDFYPLECAISLGYEPKDENNPRKGYSIWLYQFALGAEGSDWVKNLEQMRDEWYKLVSDSIIQKCMDPKSISKHLDPEKMFNPNDPDSDDIFNDLLEHPEKVPYYFKDDKFKLSFDAERKIGNYYADPANIEAVKKVLEKTFSKIKQERPSWDSVEKNAVKNFTSHIKLYYNERPLEYGGTGHHEEWTMTIQPMLSSIIAQLKGETQKETVDTLNAVETIYFEEKTHGRKYKNEPNGVLWTYYVSDFTAQVVFSEESELKRKEFEFSDVVTGSSLADEQK